MSNDDSGYQINSGSSLDSGVVPFSESGVGTLATLVKSVPDTHACVVGNHGSVEESSF